MAQSKHRSNKNKAADFSYERAYWRAEKIVAGVDEAGRGALAGPVIAAAVLFKPDSKPIEGVRDSKVVPASVREELYTTICEQALCWSVGIVSASTIDHINILQATLQAMREAVDSCMVQADHLLIDGNRYQSSTIPYTTIVGGDAISLSIAAASIIAKVTRDRLMQALDTEFPLFGFAKHKGYGTRSHREQILTHGPCTEHRSTFLTKILSPQQVLFEQ